MKPNKINAVVFAIIQLICTSLFFGCNEPALESQWCDREIIADGRGYEWRDCDQYYDKDMRTRVGIFNDADYLYVFLSTHDRIMKRQIQGLGLTVWFDPVGGEEKKFGIRFPVGLPHYKWRSMLRPSSDDDLDQSREILENKQMELQILGPEEYEQKTILATDVGKYGMSVSLGEEGGNLVYELKVPLTENEKVRYAVRTDMSKHIGVGFETGKAGSGKMKEHFGKRGGGSSGGKGKRTGGHRGGGAPSGKHGKIGKGMPEPFALWTRMKLASNPDLLVNTAAKYPGVNAVQGYCKWH